MHRFQVFGLTNCPAAAVIFILLLYAFSPILGTVPGTRALQANNSTSCTCFPADVFTVYWPRKETGYRVRGELAEKIAPGECLFAQSLDDIVIVLRDFAGELDGT